LIVFLKITLFLSIFLNKIAIFAKFFLSKNLDNKPKILLDKQMFVYYNIGTSKRLFVKGVNSYAKRDEQIYVEDYNFTNGKGLCLIKNQSCRQSLG